MSLNTIYHDRALYRNGRLYHPKDSVGRVIHLNDRAVMPEPQDDDEWLKGGFTVTIHDCMEKTGHIIVVTEQGEYMEIEGRRLTVIV